MITAEEIRNLEFSKAVRGYSTEEVDNALAEAAASIDSLTAELEKLKKQLSADEEKLSEYKSTEGAVLKTLEAAKALMNDISASAEKRAQVLIRNAEIEAENKRQQAEEAVARINDEQTRLSQRLSVFKERYKSLLRSELDKFDDFSDELMGISGPVPVKTYGLKDEDISISSFTSAIETEEEAPEEAEDLSRTLVNIREDE